MMKNFGEFLSSRPAGKEAYLASQAYIFPTDIKDSTMELDFEGVKVLTPSWADEFVTPLKEVWGDKLKLVNTENPSVKVTLDFLKKLPA